MNVSPVFRTVLAFVIGLAAAVFVGLLSGLFGPGVAGVTMPALVGSVLLVVAGALIARQLGLAGRREVERMRAEIEALAGQQADLVEATRGLSDGIVDLTAGAGGSLAAVESSTAAQAGTAARTFDAIGQQREELALASRMIADLAGRVSASASAVSRVDQAITRAADLVVGLAASIEQAGVATREGDADARELARELEDLAQGIEQARRALREMRDDAEAAHEDAGEVALAMARLEGEAERIGEVIESVMHGSDAARASNERILAVTSRLASRLGGIDDVIEVIRGLAERTKLLSINASIIASEAGEHGRAFAVVAGEVKDLATSTSVAIAEISTALKALQDGFAETVESIQLGQGEVERGVDQARNAVELLRSIPARVHEAAGRMQGIAARTEQQVRQNEGVGTTVVRTVSALSQVDRMLSAQAHRNDHLIELFAAISGTADQVLLSAREHASTSREVTQGVSELNADFNRITERVKGGVAAMGKVVDLSEEVLRGTDLTRRRVEELSRMIREIRQRAAAVEQRRSMAD